MATVRGCVTVDDERKQLLHDRYHDFALALVTVRGVMTRNERESRGHLTAGRVLGRGPEGAKRRRGFTSEAMGAGP